MDLKEKIEQREKELLEFISNKIIYNIQIYCQWCFHRKLLEILIDEERKCLEKFEKDELVKILKKISPIHLSFCYWNPLSSMFNDTNNIVFRQEELFKNNNRNNIYFSFSPEISFNNFDENGFNKKFVDRVIKKYEELNIIKRTRNFGGYKYSLYDTNLLISNVKQQNKGVRLIEGRQFEYYKDYDWIYDKFSEIQKEELFNFELKKVVYKISNNLDVNDEIQNSCI